VRSEAGWLGVVKIDRRWRNAAR